MQLFTSLFVSLTFVVHFPSSLEFVSPWLWKGAVKLNDTLVFSVFNKIG
jgi:hypothetical protein